MKQIPAEPLTAAGGAAPRAQRGGPLRALIDRFEELTVAAPGNLLALFRGFLGVHVFLQSLKLRWSYPDEPIVLLVQALLLVAAVLMWLPKYYRFGLLALLSYKLYAVVTSFPMTGNHLYLETYILVFLLLFSEDRRRDEPAGPLALAGCRLIQLAVLTIYFYSGVHKLVHGFWLNGEYLGQALYAGASSGFWRSTQLLLEGAAGLFGLPLEKFPYAQSADMGRVPVEAPAWTLWVFLIVSWLTVLSEIFVPVLVLMRRTRRLGIHLMLWLVVAVGALSWETEFMFLAIGCILLFFPRNAARNYIILTVVHTAWSLFVILADIRIWIL